MSLSAAVLSSVLVASCLPSEVDVVRRGTRNLRRGDFLMAQARYLHPLTLLNTTQRNDATHTRKQFAHVLFCLQLYLLSPFMRRYVRAASSAAHVALTAAMAAAAAALLAALSARAAALFCAAVLFVSLLCPLWLVRIHKFKAKINGPWDEAVPHVPTHLLVGGGGDNGGGEGLADGDGREGGRGSGGKE